MKSSFETHVMWSAAARSRFGLIHLIRIFALRLRGLCLSSGLKDFHAKAPGKSEAAKKKYFESRALRTSAFNLSNCLTFKRYLPQRALRLSQRCAEEKLSKCDG